MDKDRKAEAQTSDPHNARSSVESGTQPSELKESLKELLGDVRRLVRFAVETGQLPASVDARTLYQIRLNYDRTGSVSEEDFGTLVSAYQTLERRLGSVNVNTLKATEDQVENGKVVVPSEASSYVRHLWWRTFINIIVILIFHIFHLSRDAFQGPTLTLQ